MARFIAPGRKREGVIILIMQRHHLDDLAGHVLQQEEWTQLNLPAIAEIDEQTRSDRRKITSARSANFFTMRAREKVSWIA